MAGFQVITEAGTVRVIETAPGEDASRLRLRPHGARRTNRTVSSHATVRLTFIGELCQPVHRNLGHVAVRKTLRVLGLAKKYGIASTDDARAMAL